MKKRIALLVSYFILTPVFIFALIAYQLSLHQGSPAQPQVMAATHKPEYKSIELTQKSTSVVVRNARIEVLKEFFARYDSPLEAFAADIVEAADKYGLDYRLVPAIAMQESTLCHKAPKETNNCWGFGIYGKKKTTFNTYSDAIEAVSKTLASEYLDKGLIEPAQIMSKYTPSNDGEWAENVSYVMERISSTYSLGSSLN